MRRVRDRGSARRGHCPGDHGPPHVPLRVRLLRALARRCSCFLSIAFTGIGLAQFSVRKKSRTSVTMACGSSLAEKYGRLHGQSFVHGASASSLGAQRLEAGAHFLGEHFRLLPGCEVTTLGKPVVVDELGIGLLRPALRCLVELIREGARSHRDLHALRREEAELVLPVESRRGNPGVRQPEQA